MPRLFALSLWPGHVLALVLTATAGGLGVWQLDAWQARRADEARDLTQTAPVALGDLMGPDDPFPGRSVGQPVDLAGSWLPGGTLFVAGRDHDGVEGYWMMTPLAVGAPNDPAIPVVLGWVVDLASAPEAPQGEAELVGWLQPPQGTGERDADPTDGIVPQLRVADVVQHVDQDLYGAYAVATVGVAGLPAADLDQLPDVGRFTALRNLLYGVEWWVFGGFVVLMWWRWVSERLAAGRAEREAGGGGEGEQPRPEPAADPTADTVVA